MRFNLGIIEPGVPYQGVSFYLEISQQSYSNIEGANRERTVQIAKGGVLPVYYWVEELFFSAAECRQFIDVLLPMMGLQKPHANIIPDAKGTIVASKGNTFIFNKGQEDETKIEYVGTSFVPTYPVPNVLPRSMTY